MDNIVLDKLLKEQARSKNKDKQYSLKIAQFKQYIWDKEKRVFPQKFVDAKGKTLQPDYLYLKDRLAGIEKAIVTFLGKKELQSIQDLYEGEMTQRILEAKEHP